MHRCLVTYGSCIMSCHRNRTPSRPAARTKWLIWPSPERSSSVAVLATTTTASTTALYKPVASRDKRTRVNILRRLYLSTVLAVAAVLFLILVVHINCNANDIIMLVKGESTAKTDGMGQPAGGSANAERQAHPSSMVDTKYWARNMEFNERYNWLDDKKPCTLIEPIVIKEQKLTISMGGGPQGGLGSVLESNIRDLILAQNGILLLDRDAVGARTDDTMFVQRLNESGDCFDLASLPTGDNGEPQMFQFEPYSNDMSWFNPANWQSELYVDDEIAHLVPESNQIPCSEDIVVFGHNPTALWSTMEANELAADQLTTFKVNFRPSEQFEGPSNANNMAGLRVSRLMIGDKSYTQSDFDRLVDLYGDNLFDFSDNKSVFSRTVMMNGDDFSDTSWPERQNILMIDESSTQLGAHDLCQDEAGCQCGNERPDLMKIICSFNYQPDMSQLPCHDPIQVPGYCNKICATSMLINMDPTKFSERFIFSILKSLNDGGSIAVGGSSDDSSSSSSSSTPSANYYSKPIFVGARRIDYNKYDITVHLMATDDANYNDILGRDVEFAQSIKQRLEKASTKSFYGIGGITIKSSVRWRQNNRRSIFTISFVILVSLATFFFVHYDSHLKFQPLRSALIVIQNQLRDRTAFSTNNGVNNRQRPPESSYISEPKILDEVAQIHNIPVVVESINDDGRQADDLNLVELDTHSISGSTCDLIEN